MKIKIVVLINDFFFNNYETFYKLLKEKDDIFDVKVLADMVITIKAKIHMLYQDF
mgnify:FL=1